MKILMTLMILSLSVSAFARDNDYNERRDIVKPLEENLERLNREGSKEWNIESEKNFKNYADFHRELERSERGKESER